MTKPLMILVLALSTTKLCAQGTVAFFNTPASAARYTCSRDLVDIGTDYVAGLYYAPAVSNTPPPDAEFVLLGPPVVFGPVPGCFMGGFRTTPTTTAPGDPAWFQVRAWNRFYGETFEEAWQHVPPFVAGRLPVFGTSNKFRVEQTGDSSARPPTEPPSLEASGLQGFLVTWALSCPPAPKLYISLSNSVATVSWPGWYGSQFRLEMSSTLPYGTNWVVLTNVAYPSSSFYVTLPVAEGQRFFRLKMTGPM